MACRFRSDGLRKEPLANGLLVLPPERREVWRHRRERQYHSLYRMERTNLRATHGVVRIRLSSSFFFAQVTRINKRINGEGDGKGKDKPSKRDYIYGWQTVWFYISKEMNVPVREVTKMNIYTFNSTLRFLNRKAKEEAAELKRIGKRSRNIK